jgi:hypothetical protein
MKVDAGRFRTQAYHNRLSYVRGLVADVGEVPVHNPIVDRHNWDILGGGSKSQIEWTDATGTLCAAPRRSVPAASIVTPNGSRKGSGECRGTP